MLNKAIAVVVGLILLALVVSVVRERSFRRQQEQVAAEELRRKTEQVSRNFKQQADEVSAKATRNLEALKKYDASLKRLGDQYHRAIANADIAEVRRTGAIIEQLHAQSAEGKAQARKQAAIAQYQAKRKQLAADYRAAIERGDTKSVARIGDDLDALEDMSKALDNLDFRDPALAPK